MQYPQTPWSLRGYSLQTAHVLDVARVRSLIPSELEVVSVWPGKTLGGIYISSYGSGSTLEYNELIVVCAITRCSGQFGVWVSHIYVDNPNSVAGGREIWGLPKELAEFTWDLRNKPSVWVRQGDQLLCSLSAEWQSPGLSLPIALSGLSKRGAELLSFGGRASGDLSLMGANLQIPNDSPFAWLGFNQLLFGAYCDRLSITIEAPQVIGSRPSTTPHARV